MKSEKRDPLAIRGGRWIAWRIRELVSSVCFNRSYVFRYDPKTVQQRNIDGLTLKTIDRNAASSGAILTALVQRFGQQSIAGDLEEVKDGAVCWVAFLGETAVAVAFTRRGKGFKRWFVPLNPGDVVIFRVRTHPECRGRGIAPALYQAVLKQTLGEHDQAYVDCRIDNKASIRSITKAGFVQIATMKPLRRKDAI